MSQYAECEYDKEGNLRIKRMISKEEFDSSKGNCYKLDDKAWKIVRGSIEI